ncbi:Uncharacterized iron-regulated membrane protein [Dyadobacter koreensis]|uniref:Uncharacterized iron-regulated membrane protein n=1 Tax=Dyadobacter koreensis TaxID=408657 RepID=A0A1H6Q3T3_9BACT|nr:PepSY-associated TM helix domain-containing protein [Dyadobacter koreensis]SEI38509.1 Uncharacterized iron-regulated membrane protein [Dyadobacter koreensis]
MKLKGLSVRLYNITFHIHTVSGIVISFALYVIFFAGAFTLFKDEFYQWENPASRQSLGKAIDYDEILYKIKQLNPSFDLSEDITIRTETTQAPLVQIYGHLIVSKGRPEQHYNTTYYPQTGTFSKDEKTTVGETLYRLHFFDHIPLIGRFLSGFVALFFAFAVITGVMIHWQNIFTKFNGFSLKGSLKNIWTNAHTVFGLLGLPFQLMYAITGAYYMLSFLVLLPVVFVFFGGNQQKALQVILPDRVLATTKDALVTTKNLKISSLLDPIKNEHNNLKLQYLQIKHYDREDGTLLAALDNTKTFAGSGSVAIALRDGRILSDNLPGKKGYAQSVLPGIARLHFATFGGLTLKIIYFFLAFFTCFVIISGVLLWKEARNKKIYNDKQKRFHHSTTMCYLAISFSLFPAVAILFNAELLVHNMENHVFWVQTIFFVFWLILTIVGLFASTEAASTRLYLFLGGLCSVAVPITNGIVTDDWIWISCAKGNYYVAGTDVFWLFSGLLSLLIAAKMKLKDKKVTESLF